MDSVSALRTWSSRLQWQIEALGPIGRSPPVGQVVTATTGAPGIDAGANADAFLRAATILVNQQGYRGASVERISAQLNVTKGSFYHHHDRKDELIAACFARTFDTIRGAQDHAAALLGQWLAASDRPVLCAGHHQVSPAGPLLRFIARSALPEHMRRDTSRTLARLAERFGQFVVDGMVDGSIRPMDPTIAAQVVAGMIDAATELPIWVPEVDSEEAATTYVRPLFEGFRTTFTTTRRTARV